MIHWIRNWDSTRIERPGFTGFQLYHGTIMVIFPNWSFQPERSGPKPIFDFSFEGLKLNYWPNRPDNWPDEKLKISVGKIVPF